MTPAYIELAAVRSRAVEVAVAYIADLRLLVVVLQIQNHSVHAARMMMEPEKVNMWKLPLLLLLLLLLLALLLANVER